MNIDSFKVDCPLSDTSDTLEILFLDTFSSQNLEERAIDDVNKKDFNVGLIQFSTAVIIRELRIIPLSTLVTADNLKGARLGATIPASFDVHFYVNDLKAKETSTFKDIGSFSYKQHDQTIFIPQIHVPTDGLFLRGQFESLTIAVLGSVTDLSNSVSHKRSNELSLSDEIKDIDDNSSTLDQAIEIKEPDDFNEFLSKPIEDDIEAFSDSYGVKSKVFREEVHSLSPSPDNFTRIRSPSPHLHLSTPKSNSSNSSKDVRSKEKKERFYGKSNFSSSSPSTSTSPNNYPLKSRLASPRKSYRSHPSDELIDRAEVRTSSSHHHHRDRYGDERPYSRIRSGRLSKERYPDERTVHSKPSSHYVSSSSSSRYNRRSRSGSRDSLYGRTQYLQTLDKPKSREVDKRNSNRDRRRSNSLDRNNDTKSVHSDTGSNSRTRSSGGHYDLNDSHRDLSPKSSSSSKHRYSSYSHSRRSRSISPNRKRRYHDSFSPYRDSRSTSMKSPEHKKSRYSSHGRPTLPDSSASLSKNDTIFNAISPSESPKIVAKISHTNSSFGKNNLSILNDNLSPFNMSPHSSLSNVSLKSLDITNFEQNEVNNADKLNSTNTSNSVNGDCAIVNKIETELFEPLSPLDDLSDLEVDDHISNNNENYEQISLSSDEDMDGIKCEVSTDDQNVDTNARKGELLEIISSDEEYADELNAVLSSDNIDYAKSYLDTAGSKYEDDEVEDTFDINKSLFDPFIVNQLKPLSFQFNSNNSSTFVDDKTFHLIAKMVSEKFYPLYSSSEEVEQTHKSLIDDLWVKNVEQLASEVMRLTSPLHFSFDNPPNEFISCEQELERFIKTLVSIAKDSLDFDLALLQKQTYKVRHLKAGIKLFIALFSCLDLRSKLTNLNLSTQLLEANLPYDLLSLYNKPYMTLSLRLLILNGLNMLCDYPEGVEYVCERQFSWIMYDTDSHNTFDETLETSKNSLTIYQFIITLMLHQQKLRLTSVFEELLEKIHLFESMRVLSQLNAQEIVEMCNDRSIECYPDSCNKINAYAIFNQLVSAFSLLSNRIHRPLCPLPNICQYELKTAIHSSTPLSAASSSTIPSNLVCKSEPDSDLFFNFIKTRVSCRHTSCSCSKIGFFSQRAFYKYLKHFDLIQQLVNMLALINDQALTASMDNSKQYSHLCEVIILLLDAITSHQQGLKFFLEDDHSTNNANLLHECLSKCRLDNPVNEKLIDFGIKFVTRLYTLNLIDDIQRSIFTAQTFEEQSEIFDLDKIDLTQTIDRLFHLYTMIYLEQSIFRETVINVLTLEHNFDAIILFLLPIASHFTSRKYSLVNERISLDSISFVYAAKLTIFCIQYMPEKNFIHFYDSYGQILFKSIETVQSFVQNGYVKLHKSDIYQNHIFKFASLANWLSPLKSGSFTSHEELATRMFVTILKKYQDECRDKFNSTDYNHLNRIFLFEPEMITAVKVLVSLCDPTSDYSKNLDPDIQLKYRHSLVHCYSYDCVSYLLTLLEALSETCLRPSHQTYVHSCNDSYSDLFAKLFYKCNGQTSQKQHSLQQHNNSFLTQGTIIIEFIRPSIRLLKLILSYLLSSVGSKFNDSTPIPILLRIYNFLNLYQLSVIRNAKLQHAKLGIKVAAASIQREIIEIFLTVYTCVYVEHSESEDALRKSVWTKMLKNVIDFTYSSPKHFASGLDIMLKILPQPFPIRTNKRINDLELANLTNFRKLWSAHLHVLKDELEHMIQLLLLCDSPTVQQKLQLVCYRLCDLYTPTVTTLAKSLTECLAHNLNVCLKLSTELDQNTYIVQQRQYSTNCVKILSLILDLFSCNVAFRIGILNAMYFFSKVDSGRKDTSKIYQFFAKLFSYLNQRKLDQDLQLSGYSLFKELLIEEEIDERNTKDVSMLLYEYFAKNRSLLIPNGVYKFPDKLASKFISASSESLNDYFNKRLPLISFCENSTELECNDASFPHEIISDDSTATPEDRPIYTRAFSHLFKSVNYLKQNYSTAKSEDSLVGENATLFNVNFSEFAKKYFDKDFDRLSKTLATLYSPIVEAPEPQIEKSNEDTKMHILPMNSKRISGIRGRGRGSFNRNDPFRSRPPNTSRPPSMHVDDFVAREQRQDPLAGLTSKSRSGHTLHVNSSSSSMSHSSNSGGKHQDYLRRRNLSSHHVLHSYPNSSKGRETGSAWN